MKIKFSRAVFVGLGLAGLIGVAQAGKVGYCPMPPNSCDSDSYFVERGRCPNGLGVCLKSYQPPGVDIEWVNCGSFNGYGYTCEIWPQGQELSYSFYASPGLSLSTSGPTYSPYVSVSCSWPDHGGTLTITVTSPFGISSSASKSLSCRYQLEP